MDERSHAAWCIICNVSLKQNWRNTGRIEFLKSWLRAQIRLFSVSSHCHMCRCTLCDAFCLDLNYQWNRFCVTASPFHLLFSFSLPLSLPHTLYLFIFVKGNPSSKAFSASCIASLYSMVVIPFLPASFSALSEGGVLQATSSLFAALWWSHLAVPLPLR